jgi:hypothetical protein
MHKKNVLNLISIFFTIVMQSQINNEKYSAIHKDLYEYNLKGAVKSVVYSRILFKEDLTVFQRSSFYSAAFSLQDTYNRWEFNLYGMSLHGLGSVASARIKYKNLNNLKVSPPIYRRI